MDNVVHALANEGIATICGQSFYCARINGERCISKTAIELAYGHSLEWLLSQPWLRRRLSKEFRRVSPAETVIHSREFGRQVVVRAELLPDIGSAIIGASVRRSIPAEHRGLFDRAMDINMFLAGVPVRQKYRGVQ